MKIKDLSISERPRERLLSSGPQALSNGELLAVLLRSGTQSANVLDVARSLLRGCDGRLVRLSQLSGSELQRAPGVGASKAAVILAAFELGRRFADERAGSPGRPVTGARTVYDMMAPYLKGLSHEECWVLLLDKRGRVFSRERVGQGSPDEVPMDPRSVIQLALSRGARALILVHNHPAGNPEPSPADISHTNALARAASAVDLRLLDHIILSDDSFYSFSDERLYPAM